MTLCLHFANSARLRVRRRLVQAGGALEHMDLHARYGIVEHPTQGIVLVDTGYGPAVTEGAQRSGALKLYARILAPQLVADGAIPAVLRRLGATPDDVGAVILTHLHADHVSQLCQLPRARLLVPRQAAAPALARSQMGNLRHGIFPELLPPDFGVRVEFLEDCPRVAAPDGDADGRDVFGDGSVVAFPLPGHAEGHTGLWFPGLEGGPIYGCDAAWLSDDLDSGRLPGSPARLVLHSRRQAERSLVRLGALKAARHHVLLCHDPAPTPFDLVLGGAS